VRKSDPRRLNLLNAICHVFLVILASAVGCEMARSSVAFGSESDAGVDTRIDDADGCFSLTKNSAQATTRDPWPTR